MEKAARARAVIGVSGEASDECYEMSSNRFLLRERVARRTGAVNGSGRPRRRSRSCLVERQGPWSEDPMPLAYVRRETARRGEGLIALVVHLQDERETGHLATG